MSEAWHTRSFVSSAFYAALNQGKLCQRKLWFIRGRESLDPSLGCPHATRRIGVGCVEMSLVSGGISPS